MSPSDDLDLGAALRSLRHLRGLGLEEASRRSGVSKAAISSWEIGSRRPRGAALARHFEALKADPRTKARLLHLADPQQAQRVLAGSPFGAPVMFGTVLRLVRRQKGVSQTDLCGRLGVAQATVSRWETGDDVPTPGILATLSLALGASAEEALALASAAEAGNAGLPNEPEEVLAQIHGFVPGTLREPVLLGMESELWRRATRNSRWDACLISVLSARACLLVAEERHAQVSSLVRRAVSLAHTEAERIQAVPAIGSLAHAALGLGRGLGEATELAGGWTERLPDSSAKAWMLRQRGMGLVRAGRVGEGVEWVARSSEMDLGTKPDHPEPWSHHAEMLVEAYLAAGDARRAATIVDGRRERLFPSHLFVRIEHALGRSVSEAEMEYLRFHTHHVDATRMAKRRLAGIESRQARLAGSRSEPRSAHGEPPPKDPGTEDRLWEVVQREHRG